MNVIVFVVEGGGTEPRAPCGPDVSRLGSRVKPLANGILQVPLDHNHSQRSRTNERCSSCEQVLVTARELLVR